MFLLILIYSQSSSVSTIRTFSGSKNKLDGSSFAESMDRSQSRPEDNKQDRSQGSSNYRCSDSEEEKKLPQSNTDCNNSSSKSCTEEIENSVEEVKHSKIHFIKETVYF